MESHSHVFTVCGSMWHLLDGELFSGKGVLLCRVLTPSGIVNVYNTHVGGHYRELTYGVMPSFSNIIIIINNNYSNSDLLVVAN